MKKKNMKKKLYILIFVFFIFSFVSITYAWFNGMEETGTNLDIKVRAWNVDFLQGDTEVNNSVVISSSEIYPGMDMIVEEVTIKNLGDADAKLSATVDYARIMDEVEYIPSDILPNEAIKDALSHDYPFKINFEFMNGDYLDPHTGETTFRVSLSWPLDTGNNELDTQWGNKAYLFSESESQKLIDDPAYEIRKPIDIAINITASQTSITDEDGDINYRLGDTILYDVVNNKSCTTVSSTCLLTKVIDNNNLYGDTTVNLLPNINTTYTMGTQANYQTVIDNYNTSWAVSARALTASDLLKIISNDIAGSFLKKEGYDDIIIGDLDYNDRLNAQMNNVVLNGAYYTYSNMYYDYLVTNDCMWTNTIYNPTTSFAVISEGSLSSKIYEYDNNLECKIVPVITVSKDSF